MTQRGLRSRNQKTDPLDPQITQIGRWQGESFWKNLRHLRHLWIFRKGSGN
jgi:hypothetical protein